MTSPQRGRAGRQVSGPYYSMTPWDVTPNRMHQISVPH